MLFFKGDVRVTSPCTQNILTNQKKKKTQKTNKQNGIYQLNGILIKTKCSCVIF